MHLLSHEIKFPHPSESDENGLLAIGGDLSSERLKHAYNNGIFPWCNENEPLLWWSPNPRMVLFPRELRISKSMKVILRKEVFNITFNKAFHEVIRQCAKIKRDDQEDTWITNDMINAYSKLHKEGYAISVEVWKDEKLVGGLYGINLKDKKICLHQDVGSMVGS